MSNLYELLTMADVIREYRMPNSRLIDDLKSGKIAAWKEETAMPDYVGRWYIPRKNVEQRIDELARGES